MKYIAAFFLSILISNSYAIENNWVLSEIQSTNSSTIGYIFHTESMTLIRGDSAHTELQLVCSTVTDMPKKMILSFGTIIPDDLSSKNIIIRVDDKEVKSINKWEYISNILFKNTDDSAPLINKMMAGGIISFELNTGKEHWIATFSLRNFNKKYKDFILGCQRK